MNLPKGHQAIMPYLILKDALQFIDFTKQVFGATLLADMPEMREDNISVKHSEVIINGCTIMFTDASEQWKTQTANLFIYVDNADNTFRKALDAGASTISELSTQSYGRTCGVLDPFGNTWWITSVV